MSKPKKDELERQIDQLRGKLKDKKKFTHEDLILLLELEKQVQLLSR